MVGIAAAIGVTVVAGAVAFGAVTGVRALIKTVRQRYRVSEGAEPQLSCAPSSNLTEMAASA